MRAMETVGGGDLKCIYILCMSFSVKELGKTSVAPHSDPKERAVNPASWRLSGYFSRWRKMTGLCSERACSPHVAESPATCSGDAVACKACID